MRYVSQECACVETISAYFLSNSLHSNDRKYTTIKIGLSPSIVFCHRNLKLGMIHKAYLLPFMATRSPNKCNTVSDICKDLESK